MSETSAVRSKFISSRLKRIVLWSAVAHDFGGSKPHALPATIPDCPPWEEKYFCFSEMQTTVTIHLSHPFCRSGIILTIFILRYLDAK